MMDYETATDFELNKRLAGLFLPCDYDFKDEKVLLVNTNTYVGAHGEPYEVVEAYSEFNPCNSWSDIMPITVDLGVSLSPVDPKDYYEAIEFDNNGYIRISITDKHPQRALVICCIKVLESKGK